MTARLVVDVSGDLINGSGLENFPTASVRRTAGADDVIHTFLAVYQGNGSGSGWSSREESRVPRDRNETF